LPFHCPGASTILSDFSSPIALLSCALVAGDILDHIIGQGYEVSAVQSLTFEKPQAEEFLKVRTARTVLRIPHGFTACAAFTAWWLLLKCCAMHPAHAIWRST
jgi:hypothetical protein